MEEGEITMNELEEILELLNTGGVPVIWYKLQYPEYKKLFNKLLRNKKIMRVKDGNMYCQAKGWDKYILYRGV